MNVENNATYLRLLGNPSIHYSRTQPFPTKGYILLAIASTSTQFKISRQKAATVMWENAPQSRAMANLRQLLVRVQRDQPSDAPIISTTASEVILMPGGIKSDLSLFLKSLQSSDISQKVDGIDNFGGELLDGLEFDGEQLNLWLLAERADLRERLLSASASALEEITRFGADKSGYIGRIAERLLAVEKDNPECYRLILNAFARCGDQQGIDRTTRLMNSVLGEHGTKPSVVTLKASPSAGPAQSKDGNSTSRGKFEALGDVPRIAFSPPRQIASHMAESFSRAFVEDVANSLSRFKTFKVLAPYSSLKAFEKDDVDLIQHLKADYHINSLLIPGTDRISFTFLNAATSEIVWSAEYSLNPEDIHNTFRVLSKTVATNLAQQIERYLINNARPSDSTGYLHVLRGQEILKTCSLATVRRARKEFRQGLSQDKNLAVARARIAQTLQLEWLLLGGTDPHLLHRAKAEANEAIEIDPSAGMGHWMAAVIALYQRDYGTSANKFHEAEALCPNSSDLLLQHADALAHFGKPKDAWERFEQAINLNPLAPDIYWWAGASIAFKQEDYATAVDLCGRMEDDEPALRVLTASLALTGQMEAARQCAHRLTEIYPGMTAGEIVRLSPDKDPKANEIFLEGLRLAGMG